MIHRCVFRTAKATPGLLITDKGVCRTDPATPGLLITDKSVCRIAPAAPGLLRMVKQSLVLFWISVKSRIKHLARLNFFLFDSLKE